MLWMHWWMVWEELSIVQIESGTNQDFCSRTDQSDPTFDRSDVVQLLGTRRKLDQLGMMSDRSNRRRFRGKMDLLGLFDGESLSHAFSNSRELLWSVWDSHSEIKLLIGLM